MRAEAIVMTASTTPAVRCWGRYKRVAVVIVDRDELDKLGHELPTSISGHARGVIRVVAKWENLSVGLTERCAYRRALREAERVAAEINEKIKEGAWK